MVAQARGLFGRSALRARADGAGLESINCGVEVTGLRAARFVASEASSSAPSIGQSAAACNYPYSPRKLITHGWGVKILATPCMLDSQEPDCGASDELGYEVMWDFEDLYSHETIHVLERVEISGASGCNVAVSGAWGFASAGCDELWNLNHDPDIGELENRIGIGEIIRTVEIVIEYISPVLNKCVLTPSSNAVQTPDQDDGIGWVIAMQSINQAYSGNLGALTVGARADVRYPNGDTVRFLIWKINQDGVSEIDRLWNGIPNPNNTPCK
jgi:hypothetical protein